MNAVQCKMARAALDWGVRDLAYAAGVSTHTITRLEAGDQLRDKTIAKIEGVLVDAGIAFLPDDGGGAGVRYLPPANEDK